MLGTAPSPKVLEEAPAPLVSKDKLDAMRQAAIDAARAVDYVGAGTVEFIVEQDGTAYFMEMNTRLQVEHPVTEMITDVDLVEWQLRVAFGEPLPKQQHQLNIHGHAIEARVYAEEPEKGFIPAIGQISYLHYPEQNRHVRVDSGIVQGDEISTYYDPMIAKLIVWGENREAALLQMHHALGQFHVDGLGNNIAFLDRIIRCDAFKTAKLDTNLIQREDEFLFKNIPLLAPELVVATALTELLLRLSKNKPATNSVWQSETLWRVNIRPNYNISFKLNETIFQVNLIAEEKGFIADYQGEKFHIAGELLNSHTAHFNINGKQEKIAFNQNVQGLTIFKNGQSHKFGYIQQNFSAEDEQGTEGNLKAPMPGVITQVLVASNDHVKKAMYS